MKIVKVKNKPENIKAINFLGKFSQDKSLLDETVKMIALLDKLKK